MIIGFKENLFGRFKFNESDIALKTSMFNVLQLIHCCQVVNMEEFAEYNKDNIDTKASSSKKSRSKKSLPSSKTLKKSKHPRNQIDDQLEPKMHLQNQASSACKRRTSKLDQIQYFPVFIVKNPKYNQQEEQEHVVGSPKGSATR